jgi:hypothetical protein
MEIKTGVVDYSSPISGSGPRAQDTAVVFPSALASAAVGITGYTVAYGNNNDHHVGLIDVQVSPTINDNVVIVHSQLGLRDWSGNWDDPYYGSIEFVVLADLSPVPPRADLIVAALETNQAVQFFRADTYLSPLTAVPDNAIPLYAGKATGLRVYPDWDASLGLPLQALTGTVTVTPAGSGSSTILQPLNPGNAALSIPSQCIAPHADDTTNLAVLEQTLNFMIPANLCNGELTIDVQLWDQANPHSKSAHFTRTLVFVSLPTLNLFLVGVNYTGTGGPSSTTLNLPAPTQAAFTAAGFAYLQKVYPMGNIQQTGYTTITFGEDVNFTIGKSGGCGKGMNDLLSRLSDMRGSSNDIYLAVLPPLSQIQEPNSNIGGCATTGGGVGAVFVDQTLDVPHECGHALGRSHAPCDPNVCTPPPANVDPNYPKYGAFPGGSIGVFGFDPAGYQLFNPASTFDTMAYEFPQWISAYTYLALAGAGQPGEGGSSPGLASAHAVTGVPIETLFLNLSVNRDRSIRRNVSFHFPANPRYQRPCEEFTVELLDVDREVLICSPLSCDCAAVGTHCWPKRSRTALPFPKESRWLLIYEGDRKLHEEWIPRPPRVTIEGVEETDAGSTLVWRAQRQGDDDDTSCCELWYLVQWYDEEYDVWRGMAPRTRAQRMVIPSALLEGKETLQVRVLASCAIATGMAVFELRGRAGDRGVPQISLVSSGTPGSSNALGNLITAVPIDALGRHVRTSQEVWLAGNYEIVHGPTLDLRSLKQGSTTLRVFLRARQHSLNKSWTVLREGNRFSLTSEGEQQATASPQEQHIHPHPRLGH